MELFELVQYTQWLPEFMTGVAASTTAAYLVGAFHMRRVYRRRYEAAVTRFTNEMEKVINLAYESSSSEGLSPRVIQTEGRTIVSVRNSFKDTLSSMQEVLNSNIDRLAEELKTLKQNPCDIKAQQAVRDTIEV